MEGRVEDEAVEEKAGEEEEDVEEEEQITKWLFNNNRKEPM